MEGYNITEAEKYLIGGIDGITGFIAKQLNYANKENIKKQFLKGDLIKLKKFNEFKSSAIPRILSEIAESIDIHIKNYWDKFDHIPFTTYFNPDLKICCLNFIEQAPIEDGDKQIIIKGIQTFEADIYAIDLLRHIFDDSPTPEMTALFLYVPDISIELEQRLSALNNHINLVTKAIIKNKEILNNSRKSHIKTCATILNQYLEAYLKRINTDLDYYINQLQTNFANILDAKSNKADILNSLFENQQKLDIYLSYERTLMQKGYIDPENNTWLKSPIMFIKFYQYCQIKGLFKMIFNGKTKGIARLRELYSFEEGKSLDKPSKRNSINPKTIKDDYFFLTI